MILAISVCIILLGILLGTIGNFSHKSYVVSLLTAALIAGVLFWSQKKKQKLTVFFELQNPAKGCALLSLFCLILNGIWVLVFHPVQAPDYQTFFQAATDLANGEALSGKDYIAMFPHILGYAAFLSVFFRLFSESSGQLIQCFQKRRLFPPVLQNSCFMLKKPIEFR